MSQNSTFRLTQLASAVAVALAAPPAVLAAGMPGAGTVTVGTVQAIQSKGATAPTNTGGAAGTIITGLESGNALAVTGNAVVQWGGFTPGKPATVPFTTPAVENNIAGFNVAAGNTLYVGGTKAGLALLNVDASGNPSVIAGTIDTNVAANPVNIFISNANGITLTSGGTILAPNVGLIGADLSTQPGANGLPAANAVQTAFGAGAVPVEFSGTGGTVDVEGTITPAAAGAGNLIVAGSGSVNVHFAKVTTGNTQIYGGTGLSSLTTAAVATPDLGSATKQAQGYAAADVTVTDAPLALSKVYANGDLTFAGTSTLPVLGNYAWTGTLTNSNTLSMQGTVIAGSDYNAAKAAGSTGYNNPWFNTPSPSGTGFVQTPVGGLANSGTIYPGGTNLTLVANGIDNTGTLNVGVGGALGAYSGQGDITLGGTVEGSKATPAIISATVGTNTSGDITVSAPLTITNDATAPSFTVTAANKGNVTISGAVNVSDATGADNSGVSEYAVQGASITISGDQTVLGTSGTDTQQPTATLNVNQNGQTVTISKGVTLTAGNVMIGTGKDGSVPTTPAVNGYQNRVNLVADGNITATNTGDVAPQAFRDGIVNIYGTNVSGSGDGVITAQVLGIQASGHVRKSQPLLTDDYWSNGLVVKTVGANPTVNLLPDGTARQFWNLRVDGDATVNSDTFNGPTFTGPTLTGTTGAGEANPNATSQVMFMATGNITVGGSTFLGGGNMDFRGPNATAQIYWPGLLYLSTIDSLASPRTIGSGSITAVGSVNNSLAQPVSCCQGQYFMTNNLSIGGSIFTNMNSYVNYASQDQVDQYAGITYAVAFAPSDISNTLNMVPNTDIGHVYDPVAGY